MSEKTYVVGELADVAEVFKEEGTPPCQGLDLGSASIWILPTFRADRWLFEGSTVEALKLATSLGIEARLLTEEPKPRFLIQKSADLVLPALLVFLQGAQQVPWSMLANYLTSLLALHREAPQVRSRIYLKTPNKVLRVDYQGPQSGHDSALREVRRMLDA